MTYKHKSSGFYVNKGQTEVTLEDLLKLLIKASKNFDYNPVIKVEEKETRYEIVLSNYISDLDDYYVN